MTGLLVRDCEVAGRGRIDVRVRDGHIVEIGHRLAGTGEQELAGGGGALIPGLHDHHIHLHALAADLRSVRCGPPAITNAAELAAALAAAARHGEVRATGYHESVAGLLDRDTLDAMVRSRPVRVQHRSGAVWFLNSAALAAFGLEASADPAVERDGCGRATGRLTRGDHLLRRAASDLPDLAPVGRLLASYGVTGVTDATPDLDARQHAALRAAAAGGAIPQRTLLLGAPLDDPASAGVPSKLVLDERCGLDLSDVTAQVAAAHRAGRPVAVHCVTLAEAVVAVQAIAGAGALAGDRIEHGSVLPEPLMHDIARLAVTVVTQPGFVAERGDDYLRDVDPRDVGDLYRCRSLRAAGVRVAASTDAPFGRPDPWPAIAAAVARRTVSGRVLGAAERLPPVQALELFLGTPRDPGGRPRQVVAGAPADLVLLDAPLDEVLAEPSAQRVAATVVDGAVVHPPPDC